VSESRSLRSPVVALLLTLLLVPFVAGCGSDGGPNVPDQTEIRRLEAYNPDLNSWETLAPMPTARSTAAAVAIGTKIYVVGGKDSRRGVGSMRTLEIYDPATNSWSSGANMPTARWGPAAVAFNDEMWVMGGALTADTFYDVVEIYNPATDTWRTGESMDVARYRPAVGVVDGKIYVAGGMSTGGTDIDDFEIWDPQFSSWLTTDVMPVARGQAAYGVYGDTLYVAGGFRWVSAAQKTTLDRTDSYADGPRWMTGLAAMPLARAETASGMIGSKLYVVGGITETTGITYHNRLDIYDVLTDSWTSGAPSDTIRAEAAAAVFSGRLYVVGGYNGG